MPDHCHQDNDSHDAAVEEAAERIFMSGILDEIAADAESGRLEARDAMADAETIARLVLTSVEVICGLVEARCICSLPPEHGGAHCCECGGSWQVDADGRFETVNAPGLFGGGRVIPRFEL